MHMLQAPFIYNILQALFTNAYATGRILFMHITLVWCTKKVKSDGNDPTPFFYRCNGIFYFTRKRPFRDTVAPVGPVCTYTPAGPVYTAYIGPLLNPHTSVHVGTCAFASANVHIRCTSLRLHLYSVII